MQEHTKDQDISKTRRTNPIHIVEGLRGPGAHADALRDVHMSLVRAEQNLFNLVQASQANGSTFGPASFGYAASPPFAAGFAPGFAPTFAAPATVPVANGQGIAYGIPASPWTSGTPASPAWNPLAAAAAWSQIAPVMTPASVVGPAYAQQSLAHAAALANLAGRIPACDLSDEGKQFVCQLDLPGLRADQVELICSERTVVVVAYREAEGEVASLVQSERSTATLQRTIALPNEILPGGAKATLSNGVLTVVLPKAQPTEGPRRIKVQG